MWTIFFVPTVFNVLLKNADATVSLGTGSAERPGQRHVYVVRDPNYGGGSNSVRARAEREEPRCLTCELAVWPARLHYANCSFWSARFPFAKPSVGITHYVLECGGPGPPLAGLHDARTHKLERILYDTRPYRWVLYLNCDRFCISNFAKTF